MSGGPKASHPEPHDAVELSSRLNWLRAGVLGANDGIVSVAALVVGVAAVTDERGIILAAGMAALLGGAISMALGEYVSVSSQSDSQKALMAKERAELEEFPAEELDELAALYEAKGLSPATARTVAEELTAKDALSAHLETELGITEDSVVSPVAAAISSFVSFVVGAIIPLLAILLPPPEIRIPIAFAAVLVALVLTGLISARLGQSNALKATLRIVIGGALALGATFLLGWALGTSGVA